MTSQIAQILANSGISAQVSARLQQELGKFLVGAVVRSHLPQVWWFTSESGSATFHVDQNGVANVYDGQGWSPDVSISWTDAAFYAALALRDRTKIPAEAGLPDIQIHTSKGGRAFGQVRTQLGL